MRHEQLDDPDPPPAQVVGMDAEQVAARYRAQGYRVELVPERVDGSRPVTADLSSRRIRLLVADSGLVERAWRG